MWQALVVFLVLIFPFKILPSSLSFRSTKFIAEHPFGLLTEDYGILNREDLKINTCLASPVKFDPSKLSAYPYWQCFKARNAKMTCEGYGRLEDYDEPVTQLIVTIQNDYEIHEYMSSRQMPIKDCVQYKKDWFRLLKNQIYICLSGEFLSKKKDANGMEQWSWIFDRYKTKNGCDSYAVGGCSVEGKILA